LLPSLGEEDRAPSRDPGGGEVDATTPQEELSGSKLKVELRCWSLDMVASMRTNVQGSKVGRVHGARWQGANGGIGGG